MSTKNGDLKRQAISDVLVTDAVGVELFEQLYARYKNADMKSLEVRKEKYFAVHNILAHLKAEGRLWRKDGSLVY